MQNLFEPSGKQRIQSIDVLRGAVMLIMALDHTRDFLHNAGINGDPTDMATTTPILFFTRWITHFCAPNFVFLSGISAYLAGQRRTGSELSAFLIRRGLWIICVELVLISFVFSLNPLYNYFVLQVLWAIGFSMIILGLLVRTNLTVIGITGALIFFGHNILDYLQLPKTGIGNTLFRLFFTAQGTVLQLNPTHFIFDLYAVGPWLSIMLLGYVCGVLFKPSFDAQRRRKILLYTGLCAVSAFVILRLINHYGDPSPWSVQRNGVYTTLSFFNVSKYPPSLLYSTMTIGTGLIVLSLTENAFGKFATILKVYGSVPFFYYIPHFYLIRLISVITFFATGHTVSQIVTPNSPFLFSATNSGFNLGVVYLFWFGVIATLYFPCRWFSKYKQTHKQWWLSYL